MTDARKIGFGWGLCCGMCIVAALTLSQWFAVGAVLTAACCWVFRSNDLD